MICTSIEEQVDKEQYSRIDRICSIGMVKFEGRSDLEVLRLELPMLVISVEKKQNIMIR